MKLDVRFSLAFDEVSDLQIVVSRYCRSFFSGQCFVAVWSTGLFKCIFDPHDIESLALALYDAVHDYGVHLRSYWFGVDLDQGFYYLGYDDDYVFASGYYVDFCCCFRNSNSVALRS